MTNKSQNFFEQFQETIEKQDLSFSKESVGRIEALGDGVITASGLSDVMAGELLDLGNGKSGLALNLKESEVGIVALSDTEGLRAGQSIRKTGKILSVGVSDEIVGRIINPLGKALDGKGDINSKKDMLLERIAPGVISRESVKQPLQTGIKAIDAMIPIGRGQRELIIGDRQTGKTSIALSTIINQYDQDVICVYVSIGQKRSSLAQISEILESHGSFAYTCIVAATASEPASIQFLAPYAGVAVAEYFLEQGKDVLVIYDDLSKHAQAYREISLLLRRPSGREAYPGDVFYLHSRLLERACKLNPENGGGSITALPIIETQAGDVSAYIPTNVISITDGQIYLEADLFNAGMKPAINIGLSVSRVGSSAQVKAMKQVAGTMKLDLAQFRDLQAFAQFSSDLDAKTKSQLDRGLRMNEILKQSWENTLRLEEQVVVMFAVVKGYLDKVHMNDIVKWEQDFLEYMQTQNKRILEKIAQEEKISEDNEKALIAAIESFNQLTQKHNGQQ